MALEAAGIAPDDEAEACVVDVHRASQPAPQSPARTERAAYVAARRAAVARWCGPENDEALLLRHAAVEEVVLRTLPRALLRHCGAQPSASERLFLFNEQYIVKPPHSACQFAWHRDGEEQTSMCMDAATYAPYISVWCPLDDCGAHNGTLVVKPGLQAWVPPPESASCSEGVPVALAAGGVVAFSSELWHASGANGTDQPRRVLYAQYTREPLLSGSGRDRSPLAWAVPVDNAAPA